MKTKLFVFSALVLCQGCAGLVQKPTLLRAPKLSIDHHVAIGDARGLGSGVVLDVREGRARILTAAHVLEHVGTIQVFSKDPKNRRPARVIYLDIFSDLALIEVPDLGFSPVPIAKEPPQPGDLLFLTSAPGTLWFLFGSAITAGRAATRSGPCGPPLVEGCFLADLAIWQGSSGGGVLNERGELVGILHASTKDSGATMAVILDLPTIRRFLAAEAREAER
jgi:serine protease Do